MINLSFDLVRRLLEVDKRLKFEDVLLVRDMYVYCLNKYRNSELDEDSICSMVGDSLGDIIGIGGCRVFDIINILVEEGL